MKSNKIGYFIKEGISSIFTHGLMSFASVCIIVACLIIMGSFGLLAVNVNAWIREIEADNQVIAYVNESYSDSEARALQSTLEAVDNVSSAHFVSRDDAMESFVSQYGDTTMLEGLDSSTLRDRFIIYLDDIALMEETTAEVLTISGIAGTSVHYEIAQGFVTLRNVVTIVSLVLVAVLLIVSLFIISNTIKLATFERREEISIMKMVGATNSFIRWPFMVEGLFLGLMGALLAFVLQWGIYEAVLEGVIAGAGLSFLTVIPFGVIVIPLVLIFLVIGLGVGTLGSAMAIKNYLKV